MAETSPLPRFTDSLSIYVGDLRAWVFPSQVKAGRYFGLTHATISRYESGHIRPKLGYLACLARLIADRLGPTEQAVQDYQRALLQEVNKATRWCYPGEQPFRDWSELCSIAEEFTAQRQDTKVAGGPPRYQTTDWGEAPEVRDIYGRDEELECLTQWIVTDRCRLVSILGMGGIGKTALTAKLVEQIQDRFDRVIWRSLRNTPSSDDILSDCLLVLSKQPEYNLSDSVDRKISLLVDCLRDRRCLLILDNAETILRKGDTAGRYTEGYEAYGDLFRHIGEMHHQSCLVITSREKPGGLAHLEGGAAPVRTYRLGGLAPIEGQKILQERDLTAPEMAWTALVDRYSGNPLALRLVAETIQEVFASDVHQFLDYEAPVFGGVRWLFDQQFDRLSELELEIMYWLAIKREPVSVGELRASIIHPLSTGAAVEALRSVQRRSLAERSANGMTLHDVVLTYTTDRLIDQVCEEVVSGSTLLLRSHALIEAQAKEHIRQSQVRFILEPVAQRLVTSLGPAVLEEKLRHLLAALQEEEGKVPGYAGGNILNLLLHLEYDLRGYDFSGLAVRQAYLRDATLPEVSFAHADLTHSAFTDAFAGVEAIALSPDGELLALGTGSQICLWQVASEKLCAVLRGHTGLIWAVAFSPDGRILASSSADQTVRLWDVATGRTLGILCGHTDRVWSVAFSPDGKTLASGSEDLAICLWDVHTGHPLRILQGHTDTVFAVAFDSAGQLLASGSADGMVHLWDVATGQLLRILQGHTDAVNCVAFQPERHLLASGSNDRTIRLWDARTGNLTCILDRHADVVSSIAFSPDGALLASGSYDYTIRLWEIKQGLGQPVHVLRGHAQEVRSLAFGPDGSLLASGSYDRTIRLWDTKTGRVVCTWHGFSQEVRSIAFSPDGQTLASSGTDQVIRLWDTRTGQVRHSFLGHVRWATSVAFSPDGRVLASGSYDRTARLWDIQAERPLHVFRDHINWVWFVTFSPDGRTLASGGEGQKVHLWDVHTGKAVQTLEGHTLGIRCAAFHPDGQWLASGSDDQTLRLWDLNSGETLHVLEGHTDKISSVMFSPDGTSLASGSDDHTVRLWDTRAAQPSRVLEGHSRAVSAVAFSPDGTVLASGSADQTVMLWDIQTGQARHVLQGHANAVSSIAFSPDGLTLASADLDGAIRLWCVDSGECLRTLRSERPYEQMDITGAVGLTEAQKATLKVLGAVEDQV